MIVTPTFTGANAEWRAVNNGGIMTLQARLTAKGDPVWVDMLKLNTVEYEAAMLAMIEVALMTPREEDCD